MTEYRTIIQDSGDPGYVNRLLIGTPTTGVVRMEWVQARYGQIIPVNWSMVQCLEYFDSFIPLRYQVADAQNIIVKAALEHDFGWLLLIEHDTCPPPDAFIRINDYIQKGDIPIVSGLYKTKSNPSEPLIFRGRGNGAFLDWKPGDLVWCDGVPTGFILIHCSILKAMWNESPEYEVRKGNMVNVTRRVFDTPRTQWFDPETNVQNSMQGTSDLEWCTRIITGGYLEKAGWKAFAEAHPKWPFLVDTNLKCTHIDIDGRQYN